MGGWVVVVGETFSELDTGGVALLIESVLTSTTPALHVRSFQPQATVSPIVVPSARIDCVQPSNPGGDERSSTSRRPCDESERGQVALRLIAL